MQTTLSIGQFSLMVSLGCSEEERATHQKILIDIKLQFCEPPKGCYSDELNDSVCYATLVKSIAAFCENKSFKLLEHITYQIHRHIKQMLTDIPISLTVTKFPPTRNLDHCTFTISEA